ncbi:hypothetical protein PLESTB_001725200 [Pleodorina starrii]|uniref:P-type ATPase A domain-containing protein n=1 Tax=Pleodorina starrii TaxID=330485 RepID=A0A9W6BZI3_9CHLO|nr:hypothetical protein PLESTB_001725200 [Pleodorina starrii]
MTEPQYDSHPADEEGGGGGDGGWIKVQKGHRLLEYCCTRYFYTATGGGGGAARDSAAGSVGGGGPTFTPVPGVPNGFSLQLRAAAQTLAASGSAAAVAAEQQQQWDLAERQLRYGTNEMAIPVKSIPMLVFNEMWHPFYVFQYASIIIWIVGEYYTYSVCIAAITWFAIIYAATLAHNNAKRLADIAAYECEVDVLRGGEVVRLSSACLVPGELVVVGPGTLPCDMVLLRGECIVDENMLTGESVPVRKVCYNPVADGLSYEPEKCPACTLFGGTVVAQARAPRGQKAVAMVCRTRFYSAKGQLLRSILFPREHEESFISDSLKFILGMLVACMALFAWAAVVMAGVGASAESIVERFFDMITIAVPPALPACLTVATVCSIGRLRKKGIYVTGPDRITLAGQLDVICFDKTGTLTEQGLDLQGIVPVVGGAFHELVASVSLLPGGLTQLLASCHGLARMGEALVGDPLDQKLFLATQWDLIDEQPSNCDGGGDNNLPGDKQDTSSGSGSSSSGDGGGGSGGVSKGDGAGGTSGGGGGGAAAPQELGGVDGAVGQGLDGGAAATAAVEAAEATGTADGVHTYVRPPGAVHAFAVIKRFEFSAALQRNLVVVRAPDASVAVFAKGSPEALRTLVAPDSVPPDFDTRLGELTREGLRVLALAAGEVPSGVPEATLLGWTQGQTEAAVGLQLVGLAVMANPLRPDTTDVIGRLQHASIRTVMVTGDHLRTAISVAHKCNILPTHRPILLVDAADAPPQAAGLPAPPAAAAAADWAAAADGAAAAAAAAPGAVAAAPSSDGAVAVVAAPAAAAAVAAAAGSLRLSVLDADGNVTETACANGGGGGAGAGAGAGPTVSELLSRLLTGELECAVTGKGFNCLLAVPQLEPPAATGTKQHSDSPVAVAAAALQQKQRQGAGSSTGGGIPVLLAVLQRAGVFARMSPDNKRDLMMLLGGGIDAAPPGFPHLGLRAGFCGDGANDCGALKAAHVGVSLCEAEASVAAPMTSKAQSIGAMITVVAEGRCTLMATYQIFQFIIAYALVQAFEANLMYTFALNLGNYQYLIQDLFFTTVLAALMGATEPRSKLSRSRPLSRVLSAPLMLSTLAQCGVVVVFQLASLWLLQAQPGYEKTMGGAELEDVQAPENTVTYIVALAQYVVLALVFNKGRPHRSSIWTNLWLVAALVAQTAFVLYTLFSADKFTTGVQELVDMSGVMDMKFRTPLCQPPSRPRLLVGMGACAFAVEYTCVGLVKGAGWAMERRRTARKAALPQ